MLINSFQLRETNINNSSITKKYITMENKIHPENYCTNGRQNILKILIYYLNMHFIFFVSCKTIKKVLYLFLAYFCTKSLKS